MGTAMTRLGTLMMAAALLLPVATASAQTDWNKLGKGFMNKLGGQSSGGTAGTAGAGQLSVGDISAGLREALKTGVGNVVGQLGKTDGFNADQAIHIPLPDSLGTVRKTLSRVGMSGMLDDLETKLNRAAEAATPKVRELFFQAISDMTLDDARGILNGPQDAATQYFRKRMSPGLAEAMRPTVDQSLNEVGAIRAYDAAIDRYRSMPYVPDVKADLSKHVLDGGLKGIFHYLAQEEAAIRKDPAKRTTDLLRKVFAK
jgi:hypothetical protein